MTSTSYRLLAVHNILTILTFSLRLKFVVSLHKTYYRKEWGIGVQTIVCI